jgi:hypothetical protein
VPSLTKKQAEKSEIWKTEKSQRQVKKPHPTWCSYETKQTKGQNDVLQFSSNFSIDTNKKALPML